jgi:signal transduction histidine kinase
MSSPSDDDPRLPRGRLVERVGLDANRRAEQLAFFDLGAEDIARLAAHRPAAVREVDDVITRFYDHLLRFPDLDRLLHAEPGRLERLQALQRDYFLSLTDDPTALDHVEARLRVGYAHQRIGLDPAWYIGAFALYLRLILRQLVVERGDGATILPTVESLVKTIFFDIALAVRTYIYGGYVTRHTAETLERAATVAADALRAREETERMKDELAAMVVHDLKNPVHGILMMTELALRKGGDLPDAHRGYFQQIAVTCGEMMRLIQNLLEIAKIEEGKMPIAREPIALPELVRDIIQELQLTATQAGRTLGARLPTALPNALGDRALVRRVLVNLVGNALRHSGSAHVEIEANPGPRASEVTIAVRDWGRGIPAAMQERIFEKFASIRRSPADEPIRDTGLGLPFCRLAVTQMRGRIQVESTAASTRFVVTLPAQDE